MHNNAALRTLATEVASELGFTVDNDPTFAEHRGVYLDGPDHVRIILAADWRNDGRLEISGVYPREAYNVTRTEQFEIGVSQDRGAAVIAREVKRRLLPKYAPEARRVAEAIAQAEDYAHKRRCVAVRLQEAFPAGSASWRDDTVRVHTHNGGGWGDIRVMHAADMVQMDLHNVPTDLAIKIGELMRAWS